MLHVGTLLAIILYFFRDIVGLTTALFRKDADARRDRHLLLLIVVASVPTAIIGLALKSLVEQWVENMQVVGVMLLLTGTLLFISERYRRGGKRGRELARIYSPNRINTPWWSPDGMLFVTSAYLILHDGLKKYVNIDDGLPYFGGGELLLVSITGEISRLTYFTIGDSKVGEGDYVWSPDGRRIVFLLEHFSSESPPELMVVDVETKEVTNYCGLGKIPMTDDGFSIRPPDAVWSTDGRYLVITQNENLQYKVFLVLTWRMVPPGRLRTMRLQMGG